MTVTRACDACLRRAYLLGLLAGWITRALDERRAVPQLLTLSDEDLIAAVCGSRRGTIDERLGEFEPAAARELATEAGLAAVCRHDGGFPSALCEGDDAPTLLYLRGDASILDGLNQGPAVAVVGARRASSYGREVAHALGRDLASCGVCVVSGMALGIDSAAHEGALSRGGSTVAVLGCGADVAYPRTNSRLYERITANGLIVSELPPGVRPQRWSFPARNRIMAALCAMTVVVEGGDRSGSLITARFAAQLGREVGAVPGQVTASMAKGPNGLLSEGAYLVRSAADVLEALFGPGGAPSLSSREDELDAHLLELLRAVESGRSSPDEIASKAGEVPDVLAGLTELELVGLVGRDAGGGYFRRA